MRIHNHFRWEQKKKTKLTRDVPSPALVDMGASWCEWWSRRGTVGALVPRRWPEWLRSSQARYGKSDRSAQTQWPLWKQCEWPHQRALQPLHREKEKQINICLLKSSVTWKTGFHYFLNNSHLKLFLCVIFVIQNFTVFWGGGDSNSNHCTNLVLMFCYVAFAPCKVIKMCWRLRLQQIKSPKLHRMSIKS